MRTSTLFTIGRLILVVGTIVAIFGFASYDRGGVMAALMFGIAVFMPGLFMGSLLLGVAGILDKLDHIDASTDGNRPDRKEVLA